MKRLLGIILCCMLIVGCDIPEVPVETLPIEVPEITVDVPDVPEILDEPDIIKMVDNSKSPYFPPVARQRFNDCSAFTMVYYQFSYEYSRKVEEAHIFSPRLAWETIGRPMGSDLYRVLLELIEKGAPKESIYPYNSNTQVTSEVWANAAKHKIKTVEYIKFKTDIPGAIEKAKQALKEGHVLSFGTYIKSWKSKRISNNPNSTLDDSELGKSAVYWIYGTAGQHSMTIVGFNDDIWVDINDNKIIEPQELGAFKIVNSNGSRFPWVAYDSIYKVSTLEGAPDHEKRYTSMATALHKLIL